MREFLRIALVAAILPAASGCHSLRLNQGRITSVFAAAQIGAFKREKGSWPTGVGDLVAHECPALDQDREFVIGARLPREGQCQFFARLPYQLVLHPRTSDMQVEMRSATGKLVCRLVIVLPADNAHALILKVTLRTTLLTCPGEGTP